MMLSRFARAVSRRPIVTSFYRPQLAPMAALGIRSFHASSVALDDLPYHLVVGLPALSPTMESGALAEWYVSEGDAISAGDAVAKIETDKASIDFEAQDDVYVAKLLLSAGDGADLPVGTPIMITVEDEADVAAFKDYVHTAQAAPASSAPSPPTPSREPTKEATPPSPPPVEAPIAASPETEPPAAVPPTPAPAAPVAASGDGQSTTIPWARPTASGAALENFLNKQQMAYIKLYGTTGQKAAKAND